VDRALSTLRRRRVVLSAAVLAIAVYGAVWALRWELDIVQPTANLRYFYYGRAPCTLQDSALYWTFWPAYRFSRAVQDSEVHWSQRQDSKGRAGRGYEHLCRAGRRLGV
jgi:hypothetical protein